MKICIDTELLKQAGFSIPEALYLLMYDYSPSEGTIVNRLLKDGYLKRTSVQEVTKTGVKFALTAQGQSVVESFITVGDNKKESIKEYRDKLLRIATALKELFPKGRKTSNVPWTEAVPLIAKRLDVFFKKYGNFEEEQVISAAKSYVDSFKGDFTFMRVLKYFIYKEDHSTESSNSDLLTYIENSNEITTSNNNDWRTRLI